MNTGNRLLHFRAWLFDVEMMKDPAQKTGRLCIYLHALLHPCRLISLLNRSDLMIPGPHLDQHSESRDHELHLPALVARGLGALHSRKARTTASAGGACYFDTSEKLLGCSCSRYCNNHHPALRGSSTLTNSQLNQYGRSLSFSPGSWSCDGIGGVQGGVVMRGKVGRGKEMDCDGQVYGRYMPDHDAPAYAQCYIPAMRTKH